ncbi:MAG: hypothetical protein V1798_05705 [Pseudomonadota bacterium]
MNLKNPLLMLFVCSLFAGCGGEWKKHRATAYKDADEAICRNIPGWRMSFPIRNGAPKQVYFERSYCLFQVAVEKRKRELCPDVKTARVPLLNGTWFSKENCERWVDQEILVDQSATIEPGELHRFVDVNFDKLGGELRIFFQAEGTLDAYYDMLVRCTDPKEGAQTIFQSPNYHLTPGLVAKYRIEIGKAASDWLLSHRKPEVKCEAILTPTGLDSERWGRAMRLQKPKDLATTYEFRLAAAKEPKRPAAGKKARTHTKE